MSDVDELPPLRVCDLCGGVDQDPRHVVSGAIEGVYVVDESLRDVVSANLEELYKAGKATFADSQRVMADYADTTSQDRHIDCCAESGLCPDKGRENDCALRVAKAGTSKVTGAAMRKIAMSFAKKG